MLEPTRKDKILEGLNSDSTRSRVDEKNMGIFESNLAIGTP
jgi:hypothetical protein